MKIGDKVIVTDLHYAKILNGAIGTIVAEHLPDSQLSLLRGVQMWIVEFDDLKLSHQFFEEELILVEREEHTNDGPKNT